MKCKLKKLGRSTLSALLCLTMLLTTFCFFDIGSLISEAIISKGDHALTEAGTTSTPLSPPLYFYVPEAIYLVPQVNSWISQTRSQFQYFIQTLSRFATEHHGRTIDCMDYFTQAEINSIKKQLQ